MYNLSLDLSSLNVIILAGGKGTRLRKFISDKSKVMAIVNGKPFLTYLLDHLNKTGIKRIILCTGYMSHTVEIKLGNKYKNLEIIYSIEKNLLGTAGALKLAQPFIDTQYILVMNGDTFVQYDIYDLINYHYHKQAIASIVITEVDDVSRYGNIKLNIEGEIKSIEEKNNISTAGWINAGVYIMKTEILKYIPNHKPFSLEKQLFPSLIGKNLFGYKTNKGFIDIGTPDSYVNAGLFFDKHKLLPSS